MKVRLSVACLVIIAAALTVLVAWLGRTRSEAPSTPPQATQAVPLLAEDTPPLPSHPASPSTQLAATSTPPPNSPSDSNTATVLQGTKAERMREALSNHNDEPIVYYGKLEDQFGAPVPNASVRFSAAYNTGSDSGFKNGQTTSDSNGLFTVSGLTGESLSINPQKAGYALSATNGRAIYSRLFSEDERYHPDRAHPVVIKMWKLQGAEPLMGIDQQYKLRYSALPLHIDLLAGKALPTGGDIKIAASRGQQWNVQVEAVGGGLIESEGRERTTYAAPANGYVPASTFSFPTNVMGLDRGYFLMSRSGQVYSKLRIKFRFDQEPDGFLRFVLNGVANTNGSRNWEGDPNTYRPQ